MTKSNRISAIIFASALFITPGLALAQNLTPSDTVSVQMNTNNPGQNNGHLQVQYQVNGQNLNTSTESLIRFDLSALTKAGVTPSDVQSANLILFVNSGGGPAGSVTVCELAATPVWTASTVTGTKIPGCPAANSVTVTVTSSQLQNGAFISVPIPLFVQSWLGGTTNNGIELEAEAPPTGSQPENVQFDSLANNGQGFAPMIQVVTNTGVTTISTGSGLFVNGGAGPASGADTLTVDTTFLATNSSVTTAVAGGVTTAENAANASIATFATSLAGEFLSLAGGTVSGTVAAQLLNSASTFQINNTDVLQADSSNNTASGFGALKATKTLSKSMKGTDNTAHGWNVLTNVTTGNANSAVGSGAMSSEASGNNNVAHGMGALGSHTTGDDNTAIGTQAGMNLQTGTKNILMGKKSGQNLASTESWNIMVNNDGVAGDNNTIRIGKDPDTDPDPTDPNDQQSQTYIAGIKKKDQSGNTNAKHVLIDTMTGQLGVDPTSGPVSSVSPGTGLTAAGSTATSPVLAVDTTMIATVSKEQTDVGNAVNTAQGFANTAQMNAQNASLSLANGGTVAAPVTVKATVEGETINSDTTLQIKKQDALKSDANSNVAVGIGSIGSIATGAGAGKENTGTGYQSLLNLTSGSQNSACGKGALMNETTGSGNTAAGWNVLMNQNGGSNNTAIGTGAGGAYTGSESNNILVGNSGVQGESNTIHIGTDGTGAGTQQKTLIAGVWSRTTNISDALPVVVDSTGTLGTVSSSRRYKEDIHDMGVASDDLLRLRPVTFRYKKPDSDGSKPLQYGLIAEEVADVYPNLVVRGKDGKVETVQYYKLDAMLLNEVQKLSRAHAADQTEIAELRVQVAEQLKQGREQQAVLTELMAQVHGIQATVSNSRSTHSRARVASAATKKVQRKTTKPEVKHPSGQTIASLSAPMR